jgi:hypothetical protein
MRCLLDSQDAVRELKAEADHNLTVDSPDFSDDTSAVDDDFVANMG